MNADNSSFELIQELSTLMKDPGINGYLKKVTGLQDGSLDKHIVSMVEVIHDKEDKTPALDPISDLSSNASKISDFHDVSCDELINVLLDEGHDESIFQMKGLETNLVFICLELIFSRGFMRLSILSHTIIKLALKST